MGRKPLAVAVGGLELVLFRDAAGRPAALRDRCPHRWVPLSMGHCRRGHIVCAYHGWEFDGDGVCHAIPSNVTPSPPRAMAQAYSVVEREGWLWVKPCESAEAHGE